MYSAPADVFHRMIRKEHPDSIPSSTRILDFGCGKGDLVRGLLRHGYDAYGTDVGDDWIDPEGAWTRDRPAASWPNDEGRRLRTLTASPYRLPFGDGFFDVVVSDQVLEHAANKGEVFREIARVTKPGGYSIHAFPSKWRVIEPHVYVPLVSWFWPHVPLWWFKLWAFLGIRNEFQGLMHWHDVAAQNYDFSVKGIHYASKTRLKTLLRENCGSYRDYSILRQRVRQGWKARLFNRVPILAAAFACFYGTFANLWIGHAPKA